MARFFLHIFVEKPSSAKSPKLMLGFFWGWLPGCCYVVAKIF